jgi:hypothetical protein
MTKLTRLLEAAHLVTLESDERGSDLPNSPESAQAAATGELAPEQGAPASITSSDGGITEQRPFDEIYRNASVPETPFTAEKLLKLLDGLASQPLEVRKQMVRALGAADDAWKLEDVVADADRKIRALLAAKKAIAAQVAGETQRAQAKSSQIATEQQSKAETIRQQIADLNALLERTVAKATQEAAESAASLKATREAADRESTRLDSEVARLTKVSEYFSASVATKL